MKSEPAWHPRNLMAPLNYVVGMTQVHRPALMRKVIEEAVRIEEWCAVNHVNYSAQILVFSLMLKLALEESEKQHIKRRPHEHI